MDISSATVISSLVPFSTGELLAVQKFTYVLEVAQHWNIPFFQEILVPSLRLECRKSAMLNLSSRADQNGMPWNQADWEASIFGIFCLVFSVRFLFHGLFRCTRKWILFCRRILEKFGAHWQLSSSSAGMGSLCCGNHQKPAKTAYDRCQLAGTFIGLFNRRMWSLVKSSPSDQSGNNANNKELRMAVAQWIGARFGVEHMFVSFVIRSTYGRSHSQNRSHRSG